MNILIVGYYDDVLRAYNEIRLRKHAFKAWKRKFPRYTVTAKYFWKAQTGVHADSQLHKPSMQIITDIVEATSCALMCINKAYCTNI